MNTAWQRSSAIWLSMLQSNAQSCRCINTGIKILLSIRAPYSKDLGFTAKAGCSVAAQPREVRVGLSTSNLPGVVAASCLVATLPPVHKDTQLRGQDFIQRVPQVNWAEWLCSPWDTAFIASTAVSQQCCLLNLNLLLKSKSCNCDVLENWVCSQYSVLQEWELRKSLASDLIK